MGKAITWVGIDDDKRKLTVAVLRGAETREPEGYTLENEDRALRRWVRRLEREAEGGEIRLCYEAGPNGFALKRRLEAMGPVIVEVMAPSLTPRRAGRRVKTDPLDARKLVQLFRSGELTEVVVPSEGEEAARDLVRTYHRVVEETMRKRHHLLKFLLRRGRIYDGNNWTCRHRAWLAAQPWDDWKDAATFEELTSGLRELEERQKRLRQVMERVAAEDERALATALLRCFTGIDTAAALTLTTEIFAIERFRRPRDLMSYLGLTPTLYQSADRETRGGITKTGNRYARWVLGQVAWAYRHRPRVGKELQRRRKGQPAWAIAIADRAHHRLHQRYWALLHRGKSVHKVVTAIARELVSFIWEALQEAKVRARDEARRAA